MLSIGQRQLQHFDDVTGSFLYAACKYPTSICIMQPIDSNLTQLKPLLLLKEYNTILTILLHTFLQKHLPLQEPSVSIAIKSAGHHTD